MDADLQKKEEFKNITKEINKGRKMNIINNWQSLIKPSKLKLDNGE